MRWMCLLLVVVACSKKDATTEAPAPADKPHHHEDRNDPQAAPSKLTVTVAIAGRPSVTWTSDDFAKVPKMAGKASDGEARETWSLRELAHQLVGPSARVTAVVGEGGKIAIDEAKWSAADSTPILHSTRRGTLKFRYADGNGAWGDTIAKEVTGLEILP
ncbi:MAG TPA: hypothetical protein VFQ65_01410 [Kofleriaceae bacterium]|nr:hypothetical protein [Kofleriaceae bacterium]